MNKLFKAESFISLLIGCILFSMLLLIYFHWQKGQIEQTSFIYQQQQALQIAENQLALKLAHEPVEQQVRQNNLTFHIEQHADMLLVKFPLGEVRLSTSGIAKF